MTRCSALLLQHLCQIPPRALQPLVPLIHQRLWLLDERTQHIDSNLQVFRVDAQFCVFSILRGGYRRRESGGRSRLEAVSLLLGGLAFVLVLFGHDGVYSEGLLNSHSESANHVVRLKANPSLLTL